MSNTLDPDQDRRSVGPDLGPNRLQRLSADDQVAACKESVEFNEQLGLHRYPHESFFSQVVDLHETRLITYFDEVAQLLCMSLRRCKQQVGFDHKWLKVNKV